MIAQARNAGAIAKGDFNGDGIEDIAVLEEPVCDTCSGTLVRVFLGTDKGFLSSPSTYSVPVKWGAIAVGDVNGDCKSGIVVARSVSPINSGFKVSYSTPDLSTMLGRGDGTFEAQTSYTLLGAPAASTFSTSAYLIDVNHDGKLDLLGDRGTALGKGNGEFNKPIPLPFYPWSHHGSRPRRLQCQRSRRSRCRNRYL